MSAKEVLYFEVGRLAVQRNDREVNTPVGRTSKYELPRVVEYLDFV